MHALWLGRGLISTLLLPLSWLTGIIVARKTYRYRRRPELTLCSQHPVVVIGNIYVGGTGKTPVVIALVQALQARGWRPGVISRGYGARRNAQARTGRGDLDPHNFGDEPALIAKITGVPVAVHARRVLALEALQESYPDVDIIIADDGLQHLALGRDIEIVVQDSRGIGNGRLLPSGPLREPPGRLASVDVLITNLEPGRPAPASLPTAARQLTMSLAPTHITQLATGLALDWAVWKSRHTRASVAAVAGIGQPGRFFSMLRAGGINLAQAVCLPDHAGFDPSPFGAVPAELILITAKDAVKCAHIKDERIWVVNVEPEFSDSSWLDELHEKLAAIKKAKTGRANYTV